MSHFINISILKRNKNYRFLWAGQSVSNFGTMITRVALPYQIYHLTHSTLMIGLLSLCQLIPLLGTALYGGVLADRHHRKKLLLIAEVLLALGCLLLILNSELKSPSILAIFLIATIMSGITGLHRPALDSITQQIVSKQDYGAASALSSFSNSAGAIAGPALAGLMIVSFGLKITFIIDLLTYVFSLVALWRLRDISKPLLNAIEPIWQSLKQGLKYAFTSQEIKGTYFVDFVAMIFGMPIALFPAMAQSFGGAKALGLLYAAPAVGALLLSFVSGWTQHVRRHGVAIAIAAALWGLAIIGFGLSKSLPWALLFLVFAGAADAVSGIFRDIVWNEIIPQHLYGRLAGVNMISYLSGPRLGDAEAGLVAAAFGVTASVVSGGVLCIAGVGVCCYFLPKFWHYRSKLV
jgi:MFS family permease